MKNLVQDLITGENRWWSPTELRQYHAMLGFTNKIGIEWEAHVDKDRYAKFGSNYLNSKGFHQTHCGNGTEWVKLFNTSNPFRLVKDLKAAHIALWRSGMNTLGGIHVNIQYLRNHSDRLNIYNCCSERSFGFNTHSDIEGDFDKYVRLEFKQGYPYLQWYELLCQFFFFAGLLRQRDIVIHLHNLDPVNGEMKFIRQTWDVYPE